MSADDIPDNLSKLALDPGGQQLKAPYVPARIRKRREQFVMVPIRWKEALGAKPRARNTVYDVAYTCCTCTGRTTGSRSNCPMGYCVTTASTGSPRGERWQTLSDVD
jgi:hypothetical protein